MVLPIVFHPEYDAHFPPEHRFPMRKYSRLAEILKQQSYASQLVWHKSPLPKAAIFRHAHNADYVAQVMRADVLPNIEKQIGFEVTQAVAKRALLATAGTLLAAELALKHGIAGNLAGGSHHAQFEHGAGFCTFNDVGVAATHLLKTGQISNALILDLDVHQGDGTAKILAAYPSLFTVSMHCKDNYPFDKALSDIDIELPRSMGDQDYLGTLSTLLAALDARPKPDIVFYNAGVDIHQDDRLGKLAMTDDGLIAREKMVLSFWRARQVPICFVIGGGYSRDVDALALRHSRAFEVAAALAAAEDPR